MLRRLYGASDQEGKPANQSGSIDRKTFARLCCEILVRQASLVNAFFVLIRRGWKRS